MHKLTVGVTGRIRWLVTAAPPHSDPLPALNGWSIASPLALRETDWQDSLHIVLSEGVCLYETSRLVLVRCDSVDDGYKHLTKLIPPFLNALRVVAKQPELPRSIAMVTGPSQFSQFDTPLAVAPTTRSLVRKYLVDSALSFSHLLAASEMVLADRVPVHAELANDASESVINSNFRSAIIFAAAAIEACAGTVLDDRYKSLLAQPPTLSHRILTIKVNRKVSTAKDPIYLTLRNGSGEGGSQFLSLLHETPLYLFNRSLKQEEPDLYCQAHSLYRTRNSLAHTGKIDATKVGLLEVSHRGAMLSLSVMNRVLAWFGEVGTTIPSADFMEISPQAESGGVAQA